MIDTIVLSLSKLDYTITHPENFIPAAHWALQARQTNYHLQSRQNPTKKELQQGIYKPKLTLTNQRNKLLSHPPHLRIELSLPKLFFGTNFTELQQKDFPALAQQLFQILQEMGIKTSLSALYAAPVLSIHYAKNIALTDGSTPYHYIQKIKEANVKLSLDTNQTDYRNEGHSYKWHSNSYEVVFYDKIKDLEKAKISDKRALEKDNALQLHLLQSFKRRKKFEVLRMEVRLTTRRKIAQLFKKLNINTTLTFKKLFKPALAKKVLLHYLDEIEAQRPPFLDYKVSDKMLLAELIFNNQHLSPKQIFQFYGLKQALTMVDLRELRSMLNRCNNRSWYRLMADAAKVQLPHASNPLKGIRKKLEEFKAIRRVI